MKMNSNPHSMSHTSNTDTSVEDSTKKPGAFAKIRRRLTVTGASQTIDGAAAQFTAEEKKSRNNVLSILNCAVNEYSGVSKKGHAPYNPRKKNQDALIMAEDVNTNTLILCVLDGHGEHGDAVAIAFQSDLTKEMINHPKWKTDVKQAAADSITKIENHVIRNGLIDTEFSGTTLSMAIIRGNRIIGVNIGDSRVIVGKIQKGSPQLVTEEITYDHKPDTPLEKERILAAGGRVFAVEYDDGIDGPPRVWLGHMDVPGLAMSRSLCDTVAHTAGVSSQPEFTERDLDPSTDRCIIIATDGLWEFVSNKETIDMVDRVRTPAEAVETLVREGGKRWLAEEQVIDDTTIICASLFGYMDA